MCIIHITAQHSLKQTAAHIRRAPHRDAPSNNRDVALSRGEFFVSMKRSGGHSQRPRRNGCVEWTLNAVFCLVDEHERLTDRGCTCMLTTSDRRMRHNMAITTTGTPRHILPILRTLTRHINLLPPNRTTLLLQTTSMNTKRISPCTLRWTPLQNSKLYRTPVCITRLLCRTRTCKRRLPRRNHPICTLRLRHPNPRTCIPHHLYTRYHLPFTPDLRQYML